MVVDMRALCLGGAVLIALFSDHTAWMLPVCGIVGLIWAAFGRGRVARTLDECDADERRFIQSCARRGKRVYVPYLDHKRSSLGFPRRSGVNADLLRQHGDYEP
jgi:hypothetical protein